MYSFTQYVLNEMAEEISLFQKLRKTITTAGTINTIKYAYGVFNEYQNKYGDDELKHKLQKLKEENLDKSDAEFLIQKARHDIIELYNWYNNNRRKAPKDIEESVSNIDEASLTGFHIRDNIAKRNAYFNAVENIENKYPGVNSFLYSASKWAYEVSPNKNEELYNLLYSLRNVKHLQDFTDQELRMIYKFIKLEGIRYSDGFESFFISATREHGTSPNGYEAITNFSHFTYDEIDTKTMEPRTKLMKAWDSLNSHLTYKNGMIFFAAISAIFMITGKSSHKKFLGDFVNFLGKLKVGRAETEDWTNIKKGYNDIFGDRSQTS